MDGISYLKIEKFGFEEEAKPGYLPGMLLVVVRILSNGNSGVVCVTNDIYKAVATQLMFISGCGNMDKLAPYVEDNVRAAKENLSKIGRDRLCNDEFEVYIISFPERTKLR